MGTHFSIWLRETGRLGTRYMAIALASVPFALFYAWAKRSNWNERVVLPCLLLLGFASAFLVWRRMGAWQVKRKVAVHPFEASWAELLKVTIQKGAPLQYRPTIDEDTLRTWNDVLASTFLISNELKMIEISLNCASEAAPVQMLTSQPTEALQQMLTGHRTPLHSKPKKPSAASETSPQSTPASAFTLGRQMRSGAHGLA